MNERDIRGFFDALGRAEFGAVAGWLDDDVELVFPGSRFGGTFRGKRKVTVFLRQNQRLFRGGLRFDVRWAGVVGERAVCHWTNAGVTRQGADYRNSGVTLFELADGKVVRIRDFLDTEKLAATWPAGARGKRER